MIKISTQRRQPANVRRVEFTTPEEKKAVCSSNVTTQAIAGCDNALLAWGDWNAFKNNVGKQFEVVGE